MMHHWKSGVAAVCLVLAPACTLTENSETQSPEAGNAVGAELEDTQEFKDNETPVVDVTITHKCKLFGHSNDDKYPMNGKEVGRVEFNEESGGTLGHSGARVTQQDKDAVVVHWWCDAYSNISYHLRVWAK